MEDTALRFIMNKRVCEKEISFLTDSFFRQLKSLSFFLIRASSFRKADYGKRISLLLLKCPRPDLGLTAFPKGL